MTLEGLIDTQPPDLCNQKQLRKIKDLSVDSDPSVDKIEQKCRIRNPSNQ